MATIHTRAVFNGEVRDVTLKTQHIMYLWSEAPNPPMDLSGRNLPGDFAEVHFVDGKKLTVELAGPGSTQGGKAAALILLSQ